MAFNDGIKTAPIAYIGVVSVIVTFVIVLLLQVVYFGQQANMLAADPSALRPPAELADLTARQLTQLTRRDVVDQDRGVVTVGISRAMELVVKELAAGKRPAEVAGPPAASSSAPSATGTPAARDQPGGADSTAQPAAGQPAADSPTSTSEPTQEK